jgi:hypothetical protein
MERNNQLKAAQEQYVLKCKDRYEQKCMELTGLEQTFKGMASAGNIPSKEMDKVCIFQFEINDSEKIF